MKKSTLLKNSFSRMVTIVLLLAIILTTSCKKGKTISPTGDGTLSFKVDGVEQTYTNLKGFNDGSSYIKVSGSKTSDTTANKLEFYFWTDGPIIDGDTYAVGDVVYNLKYLDASGTLYSITAGQITFTDETTSHVSGRFNGTIKNGSATKTITDGAFNINI